MNRLLPCLFFAFAIVLMAGCEKSSQPSYPLPDYVEQQGQALLIEQGDVRMEIVPQVAGRIGSFKFGRKELVEPLQPERHRDTGTVLWSSPQSEWMWPPVDLLDNLPYAVDTQNNRLVLTSGVDSKTGYQFSKTYVPAGDNAIAVTYRIYNRSQHTKPVAALEVTRVPPRGDVFFPMGELEPSGGLFYPLPLTHEQDISWFHYSPDTVYEDHHKIMLDGKEGWIAYRNGQHLLIKTFEDIAPAVTAEGEREIELFAHMDHIFLEIKLQSAAEVLAPDEFLTWTVVWLGRKLPPPLQGDEVTPARLADYVRAELRRR